MPVRRTETAFYKAQVSAARKALLFFEKLGKFRFPRTVRIESTNLCNANCTTCTRDIMTRGKDVMDMGLFKKVVDECSANKIRTIHLHNFGEPLIDKGLFEKIRYAKQKHINTRLFSNLSLLDKEKAGFLIDSGLSRIKISIDGNSRETYEGIRRGLSFDRVVGNINMLITERQRLKAKTPKIGLVFVETEKNRHEKADFIKRWKGRVDSINISSYHNWAGGLGDSRKDSRQLPCLRIWQTFTVLCNGDVALCCMDYDGAVKLGNVKDNTIYEIFNGKKLQKIREAHLKGDFEKIPICKNCEARR